MSEAPISTRSWNQQRLKLDVTTQPCDELITPLLLELRQEKCAHTWQPILCRRPIENVTDAYQEIISSDRPSTIYIYYTYTAGVKDAVAVANISPRVAKDSPEDGIPVLGRTFVRPKYRGQSVYGTVLNHRLYICNQLWKKQLYGVHIGTSSDRVEKVFRSSFPGRTINLGMEDIGDAGWVTALLGITDRFEAEIAAPICNLSSEQKTVDDYIRFGIENVQIDDVRGALESLRNSNKAYRLFHQFMSEMPNLYRDKG